MQHLTERRPTHCFLMKLGPSTGLKKWIIPGMLLNTSDLDINSQVNVKSVYETSFFPAICRFHCADQLKSHYNFFDIFFLTVVLVKIVNLI